MEVQFDPLKITKTQKKRNTFIWYIYCISKTMIKNIIVGLKVYGNYSEVTNNKRWS